MAINFNKIPFVQAKHYTKVDLSKDPNRKPAVIVIHSMEAPEKGETAENVAKYFSTMPDDRKASAHYNVDNNSIVQSVQTKDVAYGAGGFNRRGIHIELAGYARQKYGDWNDSYSRAMIENAAELCARILIPKFNIVPKWLSPQELRDVAAGKNITGFTTHAMISKTFKKSTHTDPGPGFPMNFFMDRVKYHMAKLKK